MENQFELKQEILKSERLRLLILMIMTILPSIVELLTILLPYEFMQKIGEASSIPFLLHLKLILSIMALGGFFGILYLYVNHLVHYKKDMPASLIIINSLTEILIPNFVAITLYYSNKSASYEVLLYSKIFPIYAFFIILSTLRFQFYFSLWFSYFVLFNFK